MSLSDLDWTNWDISRDTFGKAFVSEQKGDTCVRHALGKGVFEFLQTEKGGSFYKGCTVEQLKAKQEMVIDKVQAIYPHECAIDPLLFDGKRIHLEVEQKSLKMEIRHAFRNSKEFADAQQWASFKRDGFNFLIIGCDASYFTGCSTNKPTLHSTGSSTAEDSNVPLHAVYVEDYKVERRTFKCINSWGPGQGEEPKIQDADERITQFHAFPEIQDDDKRITQFHAFCVHLVDESKGPNGDKDFAASASVVQSPGKGLHFTIGLSFSSQSDFSESILLLKRKKSTRKL